MASNNRLVFQLGILWAVKLHELDPNPLDMRILSECSLLYEGANVGAVQGPLDDIVIKAVDQMSELPAGLRRFVKDAW